MPTLYLLERNQSPDVFKVEGLYKKLSYFIVVEGLFADLKMEVKDGVKAYYAKDSHAWRRWLEKNGDKEKSIWLIIYKKDSGKPSITYPEAVDDALCFGWIDSKPNKRDDQSFYQFFAKRNPKSNWSKRNKERVEYLIKEGRMTPAGLKMIDLAKKSGTWTALDKIHDLTVPEDLEKEFKKRKAAQINFENFPPSVRRGILEWINSAKLPATRKKRIAETVTLAAKNIRANQYRNK